MLTSILNCNSDDRYSYSFCNSIAEVDKSTWNDLNRSNNIYLSVSYLTALERGMHAEMGFRYLTFFDNKTEQAVGIAVFQLVDFKADDLLQERIPCTIADKIKTLFLSDKDLSLLICGNLYACGENGFAFNENITKDQFFDILADAISDIQNSKTHGSKISFSLIKELWLTNEDSFQTLHKASFLNFNVDVNMILNIRPEWLSFASYLESMNTKYRTRAKAVYKKSKSITTKDFETVDIEKHLATIDHLYHQVIQKADYNLGVLNVVTFLELKKLLKEDFVFTGYFIEDELIGFSSSFIYDTIVDANFLGINYEFNNTYKLYQRMLYDFVKLAIKHNKKELRFGRTAETSKSGVGALPIEMKLFARHRNLLPSKILKPLISSIQPDSFELRKPFKN